MTLHTTPEMQLMMDLHLKGADLIALSGRLFMRNCRMEASRAELAEARLILASLKASLDACELAVSEPASGHRQ